MTDEEIISLMYDHADGFSSCIQFKDDAAVIAFARAVLAHTPLAPLQQPSYTAALNNFQARVDSVLNPPQPPTDRELTECFQEGYYACDNRQGPAALAAALRHVLARWGK